LDAECHAGILALLNMQWHLFCRVHNIEKLRGRVG
jgi:hypothetical protein